MGESHQRLSAIAAAAVRKPWQLEGSLRGNAAGWRAGRVMLESVDFAVVAEVADALAIAVPAGVAELAALAVAEGVPLIAGWDTGDASPRAKLYLNASDTAPAVRARLLQATAVTTAPIPDPHVIGIDLRRSGAPEIKLYRQDADAGRLAASVASAASSLAQQDRDVAKSESAGAAGSSPAQRDSDAARLAADAGAAASSPAQQDRDVAKSESAGAAGSSPAQRDSDAAKSGGAGSAGSSLAPRDSDAAKSGGAGSAGSSLAQRDSDAAKSGGAALAGSLAQRDSDAARLVGAAAATSLVRAALAADACAGAVMSWSVGPAAAVPRAFFVATRAGAEPAIERLVSSLPGWDGARVAELLGFAPGAARSIGVSLQDGATFTVYFKPRGVAPVARLEPAARFRSGAVEVGLFIEPAELVERAFARSDRHALSYRAREGQPVPREIEALMRWACDRMMAAERAGSSPDAALLDDAPPAPWRLVRS